MSGFTGWVETVADSKSAVDYRKRVKESESASMWQSLSFGANYKAAYCMSVCPAGEDVERRDLARATISILLVMRLRSRPSRSTIEVLRSNTESSVTRTSQ